MLGIAFFYGGIGRLEQAFNTTVAQVSANLLLLAITAIILPTMGERLADLKPINSVKLSRAISFILIMVYLCYLFFQLKSHRIIYNHPSMKNWSSWSPRKFIKSVRKHSKLFLDRVSRKSPAELQLSSTEEVEEVEEAEEEEEMECPQLTMSVIVIVLVVSTVLLGFNASFATDNLDGLISHANISTTFVGIVILPLLSNDFTIIKPAQADKMDLVLALTVGKCLQTILLVIPFTVLLGWAMHRPMTLSFDAFEVTALFASVVYISSIIQRGKSHYLDGVMLCSVFLVICLTSYWV